MRPWAFYKGQFFGIIHFVNYLRKILIAFGIALLAGLFGVFIYNFDLLMLPSEERGVISLMEEAEIYDGASEGERLAEIEMDPIYISKLVFSAEATAGIAPRIELQAETSEGEVFAYSDINPIYIGEEYINLRRDDITRLSISALGSDIADIRIINEPSADPYVFLLGAAAGLCIGLLCLFGAELKSRPELAFFIIAILLGGALCLCLPRDKVGYDEEEHLKGIFGLVSLPEQTMHISDSIYHQLSVNEFSSPLISPGSEEEMAELDRWLWGSGDYRSGQQEFYYPTLINRAPAYAFQALGMKLGMLLGLPWPLVILMSRLSNLLMYALLMYAAIRRTPFGKWLMLVIGLFPQNLFMAATFSYDPFVNGCLSLGLAFILSAFIKLRDGESGALRNYVLSGTAIFFGCLPKAVYAPMALILWAPFLAVLLGKHKKKEDKLSGRAVFILIPALICICLVAAFILPTVLAPQSGGDARGGATSEVSQVGYILSHPLSYAGLLIFEILDWFTKCFVGPDCSTFMGNVVSGTSASRGFYRSFYLLLLSGCFIEPVIEGVRYRFRAMERIWILLMCGASVVLVWTSMYVAFTVPGADRIAGVQGRYFIPFLFPLYLLIADVPAMLIKRYGKGSGAAVLERLSGLWYYVMMIFPAVLLTLTIGIFVAGRFCL